MYFYFTIILGRGKVWGETHDHPFTEFNLFYFCVNDIPCRELGQIDQIQIFPAVNSTEIVQICFI